MTVLRATVVILLVDALLVTLIVVWLQQILMLWYGGVVVKAPEVGVVTSILAGVGVARSIVVVVLIIFGVIRVVENVVLA